MLQRLRFCFSRPVADAEPPPPPIFIPDELILEVLLWLPVKSLIQFTCVCKSWKLIISDPQFVKLHLRRSSDYSSAYLSHIKLLSDSKISYNGPYYRTEPHVSVYSIPLLFSSQNRYFYQIDIDYNLVGVCNGLVSFIKWNYFYYENVSSCSCCVRLWNPATGLWSQMSPPLSLSQIPLHENFGFGYDSLNDIYKMVLILDFRNSLQEPKHNVVNVYNMDGSYNWRSIRSSPALPTSLWPMPIRNGVYVSGTLNWLVLINTNTLIIFSLNLGREEYSHLSLPPPSQHVEDFRLPLILEVLKDSLCILQSDDEKGFGVWQMKEFGVQESWIKLFNFRFKEDLVHMIPSFNPIQFILSENNEILLISRHELVLYKHKDKMFKFSSRVPQYQSNYPWIFHSYVESLVSPL